MATWDSADLLSRVQKLTDSPTLDNSMTTAQWYTLLANAQQRVTRLLSSHVPDVLVGAPVALTSADGGYTYTFPSNDTPLGLTELRHGRGGAVLSPGADFSDYADYVWEGDLIRMPNGRTRTFPNGLYARYSVMPTDLDGSTAPTLQPPWARILVVYGAAEDWATIFQRDPSPYARLYQREAFGDPMSAGEVGIIGALKSAVLGRGSDAGNNGNSYWWRSNDFIR